MAVVKLLLTHPDVDVNARDKVRVRKEITVFHSVESATVIEHQRCSHYKSVMYVCSPHMSLLFELLTHSGSRKFLEARIL